MGKRRVNLHGKHSKIDSMEGPLGFGDLEGALEAVGFGVWSVSAMGHASAALTAQVWAERK